MDSETIANLRRAAVPWVAGMLARAAKSKTGRAPHVRIGARLRHVDAMGGWFPDLEDRATFCLCCDELIRRVGPGARLGRLGVETPGCRARSLALWESSRPALISALAAALAESAPKETT